MNNPYIEGAEADAFDFGYQQGKTDALEPIKAIIEESEKMMWHSSKTLENIKEKLKEQKNELV